MSKWKDWRTVLSKWAKDVIVKSIAGKRSLRFCSIPEVWWRKAYYDSDSEDSKIISEFRGGNARLGNRDNDLVDFAPVSAEGRIKVCPVCSKGELHESHVIIDCEGLIEARKVCYLDDENFYDMIETVKKRCGRNSSAKILRGFLDTQKDSPKIIRQKAEILDFLRCQFLAQWTP